MSFLKTIRRKLGFKNYYSKEDASELLKQKLTKEFQTDEGEIDWKAASIEICGSDRLNRDLEYAIKYPGSYWDYVLIWEWAGIKRIKMFEDL